jgi:DNA-binding NtrC family response regulator
VQRLLVVDDDPLIRSGFSDLVPTMRARGVELVCDAVPDAVGAYAMLDRKPCCAIINAALSGDPTNRDGIRIARQILSREDLVHCLVVIVTGHVLEDVVQADLFELGVFVFHNPVDPSRLLDVVMRAVRGRARRTQSGERLVVSPLTVDGEDIRSKLKREEKVALDRALAEAHGNVTQAGELLGQNRQWVQRAKKRFDIK